MDQNIVLLVPTSIQGEQKCMGKPKESEFTQQEQEKSYVNLSLLKHGFRVMASWRLKNVQFPPEVSMEALKEMRLLEPTFCHHI
jgi:hypothetical protein